jgi:large subunit ribosomal protein L32
MALQKRRMGRSRINHRRSAWMRNAANKPLVQNCPNCASPRLPHRICMKCGFYGGTQRIEVASEEQE